MIKLYLYICVLAAVFIMSCAGSIPEPSAEQALWASGRWPGTDLNALKEGRELYISKCSGCHSLKAPSGYTEEQWNPMMQKMGKKAKLSSLEYEKILQFVTSASKR